MEYWGVVLMTITFANGGVANYGDVERDTYSGWYTDAEVCADSAGERNAAFTFKDWLHGKPHYYFECKQRKAST